MRRKIFKRAFHQTIVLTLLSTVFLLDSVGQNGRTFKCGENDYQCWVAEYTDAIKLNSKDAEAYYSRGTAYVYLKKYDEAMKDYDRATEVNKNFDKPHAGRGHIYEVREQYDEAIRAFGKALEINPANAYASEHRADCLSKIREEVLAIQKLDDLIKSKPYNPDLYSARAESYKKIGKMKESDADLEKYRELIGKLRKNVSAECASTDYDCQIEIYNEQIKIALDYKLAGNPHSFYSGRGIAYYKKGNLDDALSDLNKVINSEYWYGKIERGYRGKIYQRKGKYEEALADFKHSTGPSFPEGYVGIGEIYLTRRDYDSAFENFEQAIFHNTRLSKAYFGRAIVYLERGKNYSESDSDMVKSVEAYKNAVKDLDTVIEIELNNVSAEVYLKRAKAYEKLGEDEKADADRQKHRESTEKPQPNELLKSSKRHFQFPTKTSRKTSFLIFAK